MTKYPGEPRYYLQQIAEAKGMSLGDALPIIAVCGDATLAWADDDYGKQVYLDDVANALSQHLYEQRPVIKYRQNNWADHDYLRDKVLRSARLRLSSLFQPDQIDAVLCKIWNIPTLADLHLFKGSDEKAMKAIETYKKELLMATTKKVDGTNQPSLMDDSKPKVDLVALGGEIGKVFGRYGLGFSGANYKKATGDLGVGASLDNGKSEATIAAQVEGWCMEQTQAAKKAEPAKLGDEIDGAMDDLDKAMGEMGKATEKVADFAKTEPPAEDKPAEEIKVEDKPVEPPARAETETIEGVLVEEDLSLDGEEEFDECDYSYKAQWTDASKRWNCELTSYVKFSPKQWAEIEQSMTGLLQLSRQNSVAFTWKTVEPPVDKLTEARKSADVLIKNAWKEWDNEESTSLRVDKLKEILNVATMPDALANYGYKGALKRVQVATHAKIEADAEEQKKRHEEESKLFEERALSTTVKQTQIVPQLPAGISYFTVRIPSPEQIPAINLLAEAATQAGIYKNIGQAKLAIWRGCELGLPMSMAVQEIFIINNRPYESAVALKAAVLASGMVERFHVKVDSERAIATVQRKGGEISEVIYTMAEAKQANLVGKDNWLKNPKMMLVHRVTRQAIKIEFADVAAGLGIRIDDDDDDDAGDLPKAASF